VIGRGEATDKGYPRDTIEYSRVANLSDAVFAIAMTLLVLGLDVPEVASGLLAQELLSAAPALGAFLLAFGLVANVWWQHHKLFSRLARLTRGLIALNLVLLCAVALLPFPTGLVGDHPTSRAAVLPFIGIFAVLVATFLALTVLAHHTGAWSHPMPASLFRWVVGGWAAALLGVLLAAAVAIWSPVAGLVVLVLSNLPEVLITRMAPDGYGDWA
jgi:uncharacterized membrane protein